MTDNQELLNLAEKVEAVGIRKVKDWHSFSSVLDRDIIAASHFFTVAAALRKKAGHA